MPAEQIREKVERRLAYTDHLMMAIIDFQNGPMAQPDPPHSHPHEQVTYVAVGDILFFMDGQQRQLSAGDTFCVPPNKKHTIQLLTERARLIDCFTPIREDFIK
jgi:quercetin dioxygenase-like cupin family protein